MPTPIEELEGRLNAQRDIIVSVLASLLSEEKIADLAHLEDESLLHNGEEDPGLEPSPAFAVEGATAREIRSILTAARARAASLGRR